MYVESVPNRSSPPAILLRESYREQGRVKKRTLANLSDWPASLVEGFCTLLKGGVAVAADGIRIRRARCHTGMPSPRWARCARSVSTGFSAGRTTSASLPWRSP